MSSPLTRLSWTKKILLGILALLLLLALLGFGVLPPVAGRLLNRTLGTGGAAPSPAAIALHGTLRVADLHGDALLWDRDLLERGTWGHIDLPRMAEGRVAVQAFTTVTKTPRGMNIEANTGDSDNITLLAVLQGWPRSTWTSLAERALFQADKLLALEERSGGGLVVVRTVADLDETLARSEDGNEPAVAAFLGIEGAHALEGELANVDRLFDAGFRMFGLTHFFDNEVGGSAHGVSGAGLSELGRQVVDRMDALGILADLAHASPALMDDVLARTRKPVVISHGGVKGTCDNARNVDDDRLRAVAATGGVLGVGLWEVALCGTRPADWARAVRHAVSVMGVDHVGLGSDWDGAVQTIVDASGTDQLVDALLDAGFAEADVRKIMGENVIRVLREVLPRGS